MQNQTPRNSPRTHNGLSKNVTFLVFPSILAIFKENPSLSSCLYFCICAVVFTFAHHTSICDKDQTNVHVSTREQPCQWRHYLDLRHSSNRANWRVAVLAGHDGSGGRGEFNGMDREKKVGTFTAQEAVPDLLLMLSLFLLLLFPLFQPFHAGTIASYLDQPTDRPTD